MKNADWKDVGIRAVKTFLEAAAAFVMAEISGAELFEIGSQMWCAIGIEPLMLPVISEEK